MRTFVPVSPRNCLPPLCISASRSLTFGELEEDVMTLFEILRRSCTTYSWCYSHHLLQQYEHPSRIHFRKWNFVLRKETAREILRPVLSIKDSRILSERTRIWKQHEQAFYLYSPYPVSISLKPSQHFLQSHLRQNAAFSFRRPCFHLPQWSLGCSRSLQHADISRLAICTLNLSWHIPSIC